MRILVLDDENEILEMITKMLNEEGYDVITAVNGIEGLKLLNRESNIDLVISDIIMPEKEGIGTIIELKNDFPEVKIFAISGGGKNEPKQYLRIAKRLGDDRTFEKYQILEKCYFKLIGDWNERYWKKIDL